MAQPLYQQPDEAQMRREIEEKLKTDASFLRIVHSMMWAYSEEVTSPNQEDTLELPADTLFDPEQITGELREAIDEANAGKKSTLEEYKEATEKWLKATE
ncbi:MAG: hypothetical protein AAF597_15465 [Bacteroidota bacterium]